MKNILILLILSIAFVFAKQHSQIKDSISDQILSSMHKPMMDTSFVESKNIEKDFLANMIPHHQGAINSSKLLLEYSSDKKLKEIAQNIIKAQEKEIIEFKEILDKKAYKETKISKKDYENFVKDEKDIMKKMMHSMHMVKASKNIEKDFMQAMIHHHQGAVDLSKQILSLSKDDKIRQIAQNIIEKQEKEIQDFKTLLEKQAK